MRKQKELTPLAMPSKSRTDNNQNLNSEKNKFLAGFTLIELLVVIAIIGLLASVVLVSLNAARQKSRDAKRISDMNQMAKAFELYFNDKNTYPTTTNVLLRNVPNMTPTYLGNFPNAPLPVDDPTGGSVCSGTTSGCGVSYNSYCYSGSANFYTVTFCLGNTTGGLSAGTHVLTPGGFQ